MHAHAQLSLTHQLILSHTHTHQTNTQKKHTHTSHPQKSYTPNTHKNKRNFIFNKKNWFFWRLKKTPSTLSSGHSHRGNMAWRNGDPFITPNPHTHKRKVPSLFEVSHFPRTLRCDNYIGKRRISMKREPQNTEKRLQ